MGGDDALFYPSLLLGAARVVTVAGHVVGPQMKMLAMAVNEGTLSDADGWGKTLAPIFRRRFCWSNPPIKWALDRLDFDAGRCACRASTRKLRGLGTPSLRPAPKHRRGDRYRQLIVEG